MNPGEREAFTLIELSVTLGILAVLVCLLIPLAGNARNRGLQAGCQNNLRQIGIALQSYLMDNDGNLPEMKAMRASKDEAVPVMDTVLAPYLTDARVFHCPAEHKGLWEKSGTSYWWYETVTLRRDGQHNLKYNTLESFFLGTGDPQKIPLILDKEGFHPGPHRINALYADGHSGPLLDSNPTAP